MKTLTVSALNDLSEIHLPLIALEDKTLQSFDHK